MCKNGSEGHFVNKNDGSPRNEIIMGSAANTDSGSTRGSSSILPYAQFSFTLEPISATNSPIVIKTFSGASKPSDYSINFNK